MYEYGENGPENKYFPKMKNTFFGYSLCGTGFYELFQRVIKEFIFVNFCFLYLFI